ncbi:MAG: cyclase family protein [Deltaproteobacteria bacterium]|nr:cyclase family protein [Deltaproteobacteria bacterium]
MAIFDVSLTLKTGMLSFPGDPTVSIRPVFSRKQGDKFNLSLLSLTTHTGTHVDAPAHYVDSEATIESMALEIMIGPGVVLDMRGINAIDRRVLEESALTDETRVFFKTNNSLKLREQAFSNNYTYITYDGAELLIERGVKLVGIDYLSVDRSDDECAPVHHLLLSSGAFIVEGLNLFDAPVGPCRIYCLPLRIEGGDGAPARVLIQTTSN